MPFVANVSPGALNIFGKPRNICAKCCITSEGLCKYVQEVHNYIHYIHYIHYVHYINYIHYIHCPMQICISFTSMYDG